MSLRSFGNACDAAGKKVDELARRVGDAAAMIGRFKVDISKFDVDMTVFRQHAGQTVDEFNIALNQLGGLKLALDGTEEKLKALNTASKESQDILKSLTDLMDKKFPDVAHDYVENFRFIIQNVLSGSQSVTEALGELQALESMLNRMGLTSGQMSQLDAFIKIFQDLLRGLERASRP